MKRWIVSALFNGNPQVGTSWGKQTRSRLKMFLWHREYAIDYLADNGKFEARNGDKFDMIVDYDVGNRILTVSITSSNWSPLANSNGHYPQAVLLLEDFFKLEHKIWFHLETLTLLEIGAINEHGRAIFPIQIKRALDQWNYDHLPGKPSVGYIGEYEHQAYHIYYDFKTKNTTKLDFWISCLTWVDCDGIELADLSELRNAEYFSHHYGACIPSGIRDKEEYLKEIKQHVPNVNTETLTSVHMMRKDWNDKMFLFEFSDLYVLHYWFTHE